MWHVSFPKLQYSVKEVDSVKGSYISKITKQFCLLEGKILINRKSGDVLHF